MEKALTADFSADAIAGVKIKPDDMNADIHASAEYRGHLVGVMAKTGRGCRKVVWTADIDAIPVREYSARGLFC